MKKVALAFSGQFRNVSKGYHYYIYPNIIEPNLKNYEFDTFVHSWFEKSYIGKSFVAASGVNASENLNNNIIETVFDLYNPKKILLEHQIVFDEKDYNTRKSALIIPKYSLSKNFSIKRVGQIIQDHEQENNFIYDIIISLRFDFGIQSIVDLSQLDVDSINMSTHGVYLGEGVDVTHGFMNSQLFGQYCQFYDYIDECFRAHNVEFCDERLMHKYLDLKQIPYHRNAYLNNYILIRG